MPSSRSEADDLRFVGGETACPYLPGRVARYEAYRVDQLEGRMYEALMARGFRRSGAVVYRPRCRGCSACQPLRVPVADFHASRSMRRVLRMNQDIRCEVGRPRATRRKFQLFRSYLNARHDGAMSQTHQAFREFLYDSPTDTIEFCYYLGAKLVGASLADRCPDGISSVYMYSDPSIPKRSLGTYSVLREIQWCADRELEYYYLGYFVAGCRKMAYKARFQPHEILQSEGSWERSLRIVR